MLAYEQLADVYNEMEKTQQIPEAMLQSWTSLIGGEKPVAPLKLRPIAVLSSAWRIYAAIRYQTLSPWLARSSPNNSTCLHPRPWGADRHIRPHLQSWKRSVRHVDNAEMLSYMSSPLMPAKPFPVYPAPRFGESWEIWGCLRQSCEWLSKCTPWAAQPSAFQAGMLQITHIGYVEEYIKDAR